MAGRSFSERSREMPHRALAIPLVAAAPLDVWNQSPRLGERVLPSKYRFRELPNVIMTPSLSGYTEGTMCFRWEAIAENLCRLVEDRPLQNVAWLAVSLAIALFPVGFLP